MTSESFETNIVKVKDWLIVRLPSDVSDHLSSRGMLMIEAQINGATFFTPLEPDGRGSHWFRVSNDLCNLLNINTGDAVTVSIKITETWCEPEVPEDMLSALQTYNVLPQWLSLTTKARWQWLRWIRFTQSSETRRKRIQTACDMLAKGKKRPCCFDHSRCTEPYVSKNGLLDI